MGIVAASSVRAKCELCPLALRLCCIRFADARCDGRAGKAVPPVVDPAVLKSLDEKLAAY